jgi:pimeloyl-ACP methyl ester carboxylesterase
MRFVLIHGGFHGAWCWERTIPELERLGHEALAIDLPGHGERRHDRSTLADRRDAIVEVLQEGDVLVGHSGGGFDCTLAADARPELIRHIVYLAAGLPIEGRPLVEATGGATKADSGGGEIARLSSTMPPSALRPTDDGRLEWVDKEAGRAIFYHDCDDATVDWAVSKLSPAPPGILVEPINLTRFWSADLPRSYILCLDDRAKPFASSMNVARRLGVVPLPIEGSHSPFLSRPVELAALLVQATTTRPVASLEPM